ncbi:hypothetical protein HRW14_00060 [Streptomyces lunaelactis]|nr:hypothetical protein [Streptomyces lunaelactis]NUK48725.1 hypothetical protein [Streptomyces lunaelactis]NUK62628.1 hypothetical protein [Streptomyces lunaelactis]
MQVRDGCQQCVGQDRTGVQQVFAVVEHQQDPLVTKVTGQRGHRRPAHVVVRFERRQHGMFEQFFLLDHGKICQPDAVGEGASHLRRQPQGEPALAHAARTRQSQQPRPREQLPRP